MTIEQCFAFVLDHEGGDKFTDDPLDLGGPTKYGISQRFNPGVDVPNLTLEQATEIYRKRYWEPCHCDELPEGLRLAVFDAAINCGPGNSIRFLQRALKVTADGVIGPQTLAAAHAATASLLSQMLTERLIFYVTREAFMRYGRGWVKRCLDLQQTVLTSQP